MSNQDSFVSGVGNESHKRSNEVITIDEDTDVKKPKVNTGAKKIPNIAEELAMNRQNVRSSSLSPLLNSDSSSNGSDKTSKSELPRPVIPETKPLPVASLLSGPNNQKLNSTEPKSNPPQSPGSVSISSLKRNDSESKLNKLKMRALLKNKSPANVRKSLSSTSEKSSTAIKLDDTEISNAVKQDNKISKVDKTSQGKKLEGTFKSSIKSKSFTEIDRIGIVSKDKQSKKKDMNAVTPKPRSPKRALPTTKSPNIMSVLEKGKTDIKTLSRPDIIIDVPLSLDDSNAYLSEDNQVIFNFQKLIDEKYGISKKAKVPKKNLTMNLLQNLSNNRSGSTLDDEINLSDDEDDFEEEESHIPVKPAVPVNGKKPHPSKGKNLIGKYDIEDPFIDDSELQWEEYRAATRDGFFVFFGPLVENEDSSAEAKLAPSNNKKLAGKNR